MGESDMSLYQMIRCALSPGMSVETSQGSLATPPLTASAADTPSETKKRVWLATFKFYPRTRVNAIDTYLTSQELYLLLFHSISTWLQLEIKFT